MSAPGVGTIVFAHDHVFHQDASGALFSRGGQFSAALWGRYLQHCSRLVVVARCAALSSLENPTQLTASSCEGVSFVPVPSLAGLGKRMLAGGAVRDALLAVLRSADLLIARLPSETGLLAIEVARQLGKPWAVECVGCAWDAHVHHPALRARLYAPIAWQRTRTAIAQAPVANFVTEQFLQRRYPTGGIAIACSDVEIEIGSVAEVLAVRAQRIQARGSERPLRFGIIGSFAHRHKGVDVALRALHAVHGKLPPFELHVLGAGDPDQMMQLANTLGLGDAFKPWAPLPRGRAVQQWLDEVDVYLQPSRYEAMPRALIEAMARACPALASDTGGITELLSAACLHPAGDHQRLAAQLIEASQSGWQRAQAQRNIAEVQRFDRGVLAGKRELFWQAIGQRAGSPVATAHGA